MPRRPINEPADTAPAKPVVAKQKTITVSLITPYPQVVPVSGIRLLPNSETLVPDNAWVRARIADEMLIEIK